ncbi:MAG: hypothetical protein U9O95_05060 [Candidatus Marinimicrobia bacterium]|nr:hypothetical protein [Candidatus Neomarinimicrobiota bacterium]
MKILSVILCLIATLPAQILLNEFMIDPENDNTGEFIEIYNMGDSIIDLREYYICDARDTDAVIAFPDSFLFPGEYGLILDPDYAGEYVYYIPDSIPLFTIPDSRFGMYGISNSTRKSFSILSREYSVLDSYITGTPDWPDPTYSIERITSFDTLWEISSTPFGSPGFRNSVSPKDYDINISNLHCYFTDSLVNIMFSINNLGLRELCGFSFGYIVDIINASFNLNDTLIFSSSELLLSDSSFHFEHAFRFRSKGLIELYAFVSIENIHDTITADLYIPISEKDLLITEFVSRTGDNFSSEYIELLSTSKLPIQVKGLGVYDMTGATFIDTHYVIYPDSMFVLAQSASFHDDFPFVDNYYIQPAWRSLNNSEDIICLQNPTGSMIITLHYDSVWDIAPDCAMQLVDTALDHSDPNNWECSFWGSPGQYNTTEKQLHHLSCFSGISFFAPQDTLKFTLINDGYFPLAENIATFHTPVSEQDIYLPGSDPGDTLFCLPDTVGIFLPGTNICSLVCEPYFSYEIKYYHPYDQSPCCFNEILFDPLNSYGQAEFIELQTMQGVLDLDHWWLQINNSKTALEGLLSNTYIALCDHDDPLRGFPSSSILVLNKFPSLPNAGAELYLIDPANRIVDQCNLRDHSAIHEGKSLEKQFSGISSNDGSIWFSSVSAEGMTPGRLNSITSLPGFYDDLDIYPDVFSPGLDDHIQFSIDSESSLQYCELFCFNLGGQIIYHSEQALFSNPSYIHFWNGRTKTGNYPARGLYLALAVLHDVKGNTRQLRETFIVR